MDYCIITVDKHSYYEATKALEEEIKFRIKSGWKPQGGVSITTYKVRYSDYYTMSQAMVKDDKDKTDFLKSQI